MPKKIEVTVAGQIVTPRNISVGNVTEDSGAVLCISFDGTWSGYYKSVVFYDKRKKKPIKYEFADSGSHVEVVLPEAVTIEYGKHPFAVVGSNADGMTKITALGYIIVDNTLFPGLNQSSVDEVRSDDAYSSFVKAYDDVSQSIDDAYAITGDALVVAEEINEKVKEVGDIASGVEGSKESAEQSAKEAKESAEEAKVERGLAESAKDTSLGILSTVEAIGRNVEEDSESAEQSAKEAKESAESIASLEATVIKNDGKEYVINFSNGTNIDITTPNLKGADGKDGRSLYFIDGSPSYNNFDDIYYYQWMGDDTLYRVGELMLFRDDNTLYRVHSRFLDTPNIVYLEPVAYIKGLKNLKDSDSAEGAVESDGSSAAAKFSFAFGEGCFAGCMGYYIKSIDFDNGKIYLTDTQVKPVSGNTDYTDATFETPGYEIGDEFSIVNGNHYNFCGVIESVKNNVVTYSGDLGFTEISGSGITGAGSYSFRVPTKPDLGLVQLSGYCFATGLETKAVGSYSHAEGYGCIADGNFSHAEGRENKTAYAAHAEGNGNKAIGNESHVEGHHTTALGGNSHAEGQNTIAKGGGSHAEGMGTQAVGSQSHSEGLNTVAKGAQSHAEGVGTQANAFCSHAEGNGTIASAAQAHAEGYQTTASGQSSHVEGQESEASGNFSHAQGIRSKATGYAAFTSGSDVEASGDVSSAMGKYATATGRAAMAVGEKVDASGSQSVAMGYGTVANQQAQMAVGKYNADDADALFVVGNGTSSKRSNAFAVDKNGNAWVSGDVKVGGTNPSNGTVVAKSNLSNVGDAVFAGKARQAGVGNEFRKTSLFDSTVTYTPGDTFVYVDVLSELTDMRTGDIIHDTCGYVFRLEEIRLNDYYEYTFFCVGKWSEEDSAEASGGVNILSVSCDYSSIEYDSEEDTTKFSYYYAFSEGTDIPGGAASVFVPDLEVGAPYIGCRIAMFDYWGDGKNNSITYDAKFKGDVTTYAGSIGKIFIIY